MSLSTKFVNKKNKFFKKFKKQINTDFSQVRVNNILLLFIYINKRKYDENTKKLDITKFKLKERFYTINKTRITNNEIKISDEAIDLVDKYNIEENSETTLKDAIGYDYNNETSDSKKIADYDDDYLVPNNKYNFFDFTKNVGKNIDLIHIFNDDIDRAESIDINKNIQTVKIKLTNIINEDDLIINSFVLCPECNSKIVFDKFDMSTSIKCCNYTEHSDSKPKTLTVHATNFGNLYKKCFINNASMYNKIEDDYKEISYPLLSTINLSLGIHEVQLIPAKVSIRGKDIIFLLILSANDSGHSKKISRIINNEPQSILDKYDSKFALEIIYEQLIKYISKNHGVEVNLSNKYLGLLLIFSSIARNFNNILFQTLAIGTSGSGKNYMTEMFCPLLDKNVGLIDASTTSKNIILGGNGQSNAMLSNPVTKGALGLNDRIILDEATSVFNPNSKNYETLTQMLKYLKNQKVPITTQGTKEYKIKSSMFMIGNLENMYQYEKYKYSVVKEYKKITGKLAFRVNSSTLFRNLKYYAIMSV